MIWLDGSVTLSTPTVQIIPASYRNTQSDGQAKKKKKPKSFICVIKQLIQVSTPKMHSWCDRDETSQVHHMVKDTKTRQNFFFISTSMCMASVSHLHRTSWSFEWDIFQIKNILKF